MFHGMLHTRFGNKLVLQNKRGKYEKIRYCDYSVLFFLRAKYFSINKIITWWSSEHFISCICGDLVKHFKRNQIIHSTQGYFLIRISIFYFDISSLFFVLLI